MDDADWEDEFYELIEKEEAKRLSAMEDEEAFGEFDDDYEADEFDDLDADWAGQYDDDPEDDLEFEDDEYENIFEDSDE